MSESLCQLCGEPMPPGEEMFQYHGYSGPCPKPFLASGSPPSGAPRGRAPEPLSDDDLTSIYETARQQFTAGGTPGWFWGHVLALIDELRALRASLATARKDNDRLTEWKDSVLNALETKQEFIDGEWAGDKRGWGFVFEFINWLYRDRASARSELDEAQRREEHRRVGSTHCGTDEVAGYGFYHAEMLSDGALFLQLGDDVFTVYFDKKQPCLNDGRKHRKGVLHMRFEESRAARSSQPGAPRIRGATRHEHEPTHAPIGRAGLPRRTRRQPVRPRQRRS